ncbi:MAG TPA: S53 family peptidase [Jatrophihabitantaceae bacterium]
MTLPGSSRRPLPQIEPLGPVAADERVEATLVLRRRAALPDGVRLTRAELAERHGADPAEMTTAADALRERGIEVLEADPASRRLRIAGAAGGLAETFGTSLSLVRRPDGVEHRYREGALTLPDALSGAVVAVLGLDNRPQARSQLRVAAIDAVGVSYTPPQLATIYNMPQGTDGTGQTIGIIELGGGFAQSDLDHYFAGLGISPPPQVTAVGVDGARNQPGQDPTGADGEVLLDIEVAGAIAPRADIVVYFAPNTDAGFVDAISQAAHASPTPTAISISWGQSEDDWTAQARDAMDAALADATAIGVTVTVASGDDGSTDRAGSGAHCDFPASSPHALGCGGTTLQADPSTGTVTRETVWNGGSSGGATGGGISDVYPVPDWQTTAGVPTRSGGGTGRGVPDVAGDADPGTGYQVYVDGQDQVFGGTSAVAPLWAGLIARLAQSLGRSLGRIQPALYAGASAGHVAPGFRDITDGDNGAYSAGRGWDACTGLGVPDGTALLDVLRDSQPG